MQRYTVYSYLETVLHVSGGTSIHHQERIQLYLQHLVFVTPLLLPAAIVEELFQPFHDSGDILEHVFSLRVTKTRLLQPVEKFRKLIPPLSLDYKCANFRSIAQ